MEKVLHPSLVKCLSSLSIRSPHLHRKLWMEQKKAIRATTLIKALGKPTLTSAQAKRVDVLGIKFEDESVSGEHHHGGLPYSLERPIASHVGEAESAGALPLDVRSAYCVFHSCRLLLLPGRTLRQRSHKLQLT